MQVADDEQLWDDAETRQAWWEEKAPADRHNFYQSSIWPMFHDLPVPNWCGLAGIVGGDPSAFLGLDVLLLGHGVPNGCLGCSSSTPRQGSHAVLAFSTPGRGMHSPGRCLASSVPASFRDGGPCALVPRAHGSTSQQGGMKRGFFRTLSRLALTQTALMECIDAFTFRTKRMWMHTANRLLTDEECGAWNVIWPRLCRHGPPTEHRSRRILASR